MRKLLVFIMIAAAPVLLVGQARKKPPVKKPVVKPTPAVVSTPVATAEPTPQPTPVVGKKNARAVEDAGAVEKKTYTPVYVYTFERPGFTWSSIRIEHDDSGKGRAWFRQDGADEPLDDPIEIPAATMGFLKKAYADLDFLNSTQDYQYPARDYTHMGNVTITMNREGKSRTAKFNWTDVKPAKLLMDMYRAISNEAIWKFEIQSARDNQPLLTPGLVDALDNYLQRNEIADPPHLAGFLTQLSTDERLPLIARNHLSRLVMKISKAN